MQKFVKLSKEEFDELSEKQRNVMYLITSNNQLKQVSVNNEVLIDYVIMTYYDPLADEDVNYRVRQLSGEKIMFPVLEAAVYSENENLGLYDAFSNWSSVNTTIANSAIDYDIVPCEDTILYANRRRLTVHPICEMLLTGDELENQNPITKCSMSFLAGKLFLEDVKLGAITFKPIVEYDEVNLTNNIYFYLLDYNYVEGVTKSYPIRVKVYKNQEKTEYVGTIPVKIIVYTSSEAEGD